jgi:predicted nucleotidyltransferase component of viral defense system
MKKRPVTNVAASVRARLSTVQSQTGRDYQGLMIQYALERLLYRLSVSRFRDRFIVKGAMLFTIWNGSPHRMTRDLDLLGFGDPSIQELENIFKELADFPVDDDGIFFDSNTIRGADIRAEARYTGVRIEMIAKLDSARLALQIDIGFGDDFQDRPDDVSLPSLLDMEAPLLRAYRRETVLAEKLEAVVQLGLQNSRLKDYFDFWFLGQNFRFEGSELTSSITATFTRRMTILPLEMPRGLTESYWSDPARIAAWNGFWNKTGIVTDKPDLETVVRFVADFLGPPLLAAGRNKTLKLTWPTGGPWKRTEEQT